MRRGSSSAGRSSTITAPTPHGTFRFDMGPTFFLYPRVLADIFAACGPAGWKDEVELIRLDPQYNLVFRERARSLPPPADMARMAEQIAKLCPADAAPTATLHGGQPREAGCVPPGAGGGRFNGMRDLARPQGCCAGLSMLRPHRSVGYRPRHLFQRSARAPGLQLPEQVPRHVAVPLPQPCSTILSYMEYEYGVYHPARRHRRRHGGDGARRPGHGRRNPDRRAGGGSAVRGAAAPSASRVAGQERRYDALVINADFAQTMTKLVPDGIRRRWSEPQDRRQEVLLQHLS